MLDSHGRQLHAVVEDDALEPGEISCSGPDEEPVARREDLRGEARPRFVANILDKEDLDQIQMESDKILDLTSFVDRASVNPLYLDAPYYIYPEGKTGIEAFRGIAQRSSIAKRPRSDALSYREHPVIVEPFGEWLLMSISTFPSASSA
jgi:DNA end-binding protein Ku